jgi:hypothetical protein
MANHVSGPHKSRTCLPSAGLQSASPAMEQPLSYALDGTATDMGSVEVTVLLHYWRYLYASRVLEIFLDSVL